MTPSAVHVGNIVQGARMAWAQGRDLGISEDETEAAKRVRKICVWLHLHIILSFKMASYRHVLIYGKGLMAFNEDLCHFNI